VKAVNLSNVELRALGWQILVKHLGPAGALRFAMQTQRGYGDYSQLRHRMLGSLSVDELVERMRSRRKPKRRRRGAKRRRNS
jgi:hypothetical protein